MLGSSSGTSLTYLRALSSTMANGKKKPDISVFQQTWNWAGVKGCLPSLRGNRPKSAFSHPFSAFFALFRRVRGAPGKSRKRRKMAFFLRYPQICLNPHLLNPHLRHQCKFLLFFFPFFVPPIPFSVSPRIPSNLHLNFCLFRLYSVFLRADLTK